MIAPLLMAVLTFAALSAWSSWRARTNLLARIRAEWGRPRDRKRDMDGIADFFRCHDAEPSLDDRTWADLLLDDVFAFLDRTESSLGQQILYYRLRLAVVPRALQAFDALTVRLGRDAPLRERAQRALARLGDPSGYYVHRLADPDVLVRRRWHVFFHYGP
jgi:hypothetical protein